MIIHLLLHPSSCCEAVSSEIKTCYLEDKLDKTLDVKGEVKLRHVLKDGKSIRMEVNNSMASEKP